MHKFLRKIITLALCVTAVGSFAAFAGCDKGVPVGDYIGAGDLTQPYFQTDRVALGINEKYVAVFSETENVVWSSEDETVATVSQSGEITALSQGATFIKATYNGVDYKCLVTVTRNNSFISLALDKTRIDNLLLGAKTAIAANLSYQGVANLTLEWSSSDENVVKISSFSNDGCEIEAVGKGNAVVTAKYENRVSAVCVVTVSDNQPQVFEGELDRPNGFENVTVSKTDFNSITTDTSDSLPDTEGKVSLLDGTCFKDVDGDGNNELVAFATLDGFDGYAIDSTFEARFAYGVLLNVLDTDAAHQAYYLKNQKIYSTSEADENGNFAVMLDDVPDGVYAVQAFVEYADGGEVVIYHSQTSALLSATVDFNRINAVKGADGLVGRVYYGWSANAYNFGDAGGYSAAYLKTETPTEAVDGKLPQAAYRWETDQIALATRLGVKSAIDKDGLLAYQRFGGVTTMYFEVYMQYSSTYQRPIKKLVGVDEAGAGIYEMISLRTNQWYTLEYDLDMLIENYDVIFNPDNTATGGLVLLATPNLRETVNDPSATNNQNVYYIGDVFFANSERYNQE
ncbi:MAG: Ig-like domain-containing protein, partial [Clostridia bacterium]|nr:Ig-like domain-containing protein [Clostridia bacterium]